MFRRYLISGLGAGSRRIHPVPAQRLWQRGFASEAAAPEGEKPAEASGPKKKVIFDKASSPELDEVFAELLHKVILPSHLPKSKRKIIMNARNAHKVQVDPVVIEVEGYEYRFPILDFNAVKIPGSRSLMWRAVHLMKTRGDWDNLIRLTSGYRYAGRKFDAKLVHGIIRFAGKTGNMYAVIDAFRNYRTSRFGIRTLPVADNTLHYLQRQALDSGYAEKPTRDASAWAQMLLEIMEDGGHAKRPSLYYRPTPLHREPQVVGQVLHLAAAQAVHHQGGRDEDGSVSKLAETLAVLWPEGKNLYNLHSQIPPKSARGRYKLTEMGDAHLRLAVSRRISTATFILHGLGLAKQVVEPALAARLEHIEKLLTDELAELVATKGEFKADEGWEIYGKLIAKTA